MSLVRYKNNLSTTLAGAISNVATAANLQSGAGAQFPSLANGEYIVLTLVDAATGLLNEIVQCTGVSGDTITIVRAQEGTVALNWLAGDIVVNDVTAGQMQLAPQVLVYTTNPNGAIAGQTGD